MLLPPPAWVLAPLLTGCEAGLDIAEKKPPREEGDDTALPDSGDATDSGDSGDPEPPPPVEYDCAALPEPGLETRELDGPRGYHDLAFDDAGMIIGWDGSSLVEADATGGTGVYATRVRSAQGMALLPDGSLVYGDDGNQRIVQVTSEGAQVTLATDAGVVYGVNLGPDGMIYMSNERGVYRIDPATGEKAEIATLPRGERPRDVQFSLDSSRMFVATTGKGNVYVFEVDDTLTPVDEGSIYATITRTSWQDGLGMDACGNLYVPDFSTRGLYKIDTTGEVSTIYKNSRDAYGHGVAWGRGYGGWRADAIYLPQPYDRLTVLELVLGVPSADTVRTLP